MTDARRSWSLPFPPRTIQGLAIAFGIGSALITALLGSVTYGLVHEELERQIDDQIEVETRALLEYQRSHGFAALLEVVRLREQRDIGVVTGMDTGVGKAMGYIVSDRSGRRRGGALRAAMPPPGYSEHIHFQRDNGSQGSAQGMNSALPGGGRLLVAVDRNAIRKMDSELFRLFVGAFGALVMMGMMATLGLGRIVRKRIAAFEELATAITAGAIEHRMPLDGSGVEFDRLAIVLNRMLDRISALVANLREVSTGLAHDLRTPLSRIRAKIERAEAGTSDASQQALLESAVGEMDALLELFGGLLAISELDGLRIRSRFTGLDLASAVIEIAEAHRPAIEDGGRSLHLAVEAAEVLGDRALLQRLVGNLIDNAMVHTPVGTTIVVQIETDDGIVALRVADDGEGVPLEDRSRIFDRLVRLDPSRSLPGHGLGLSMVSAIAAAHGGEVGIVPSGHGLCVELKLPAREAKAGAVSGDAGSSRTKVSD